LENFIGEFAGLGAALAFSFTSTLFTLAGRKLGASTILALSMPISSVVLMIVHWITFGEVIPASASLDRWFFLGISSVIGFVIGSTFLLRAFQYIGPRLSLLIGSLAPILSAILARIFLDQALPPNSVLGITVIIFGIVWVVSEGGTQKITDVNPNYRKGLLFALFAALGQAFSFVFMSQGVAGDFSAMSGGLIRAMVASVTLWLMFAVQGQLHRNLRVIWTESRSMIFILIASVTGPVIGSSFVLLSLQFTSVGVSSTLTGMSPIMLIPIGYFVFKEHITRHAIAGTIVAIVGIAILFTPT
jgi:drug/metabolite transporter (DMT)-like permease